MRPLQSVLIAAVAMLCALPAAAFAAGRPSVAVTRIHDPIRVDGALDEPAWSSTPVIGDFKLMVPREGATPDESTAVRVVVERDRIVFGIWCSARRALRASLTARDQILDGDHISIHVDTHGDGQSAYIFGVNPYGVQLDGILTTDPDFKWDAVWDAGARCEKDAWTAEIAVPFKAMRFPPGAGRPWRLWIRREITAWNEVSTWPPYLAGQSGRIMLQAADLTGLENVRGGSDLAVTPYVFGSLDAARAADGSGGLSPWSNGQSRETGVDVQTAVTSSLALNATYNPDFSQIEADALQIDLNRRFALQFPEKRPFFLEGAENFFSPLDMVYTRRMADPHWGAKLTGRAGRVNTGALIVRDHGGADLGGSGYGSSDVTTPGYFALARAQLPFGEGSNVGVLGGAHAQDAVVGVPGDPAFHADGTLNHFEGVDAQVKLSDHWDMESQLARTVARDDSARADGTKRRDAFTDGIAVMRLNYRDRTHTLQLGTRYVGAQFRDELGYQDWIGVTYKHAYFEWDFFPKAGALQRLDPVLDVLVLHDHTGRPAYADINPHVELLLRQNLYFNLGGHEYVEHWLSHNYAQERVHIYMEDTRWRPLTWNLEAQVGDGIYYGATDAESFLAWTETYTLAASVRPSPRVTSALSVLHLRVARRPGSGEVLTEWLVGANTSMQFTRRLSARIYPQYDSNTRHLDANVLVSYVVHPGTVLYLGVNGAADRIGPRQRLTARQYFAKASYRLAI